MFSLAWLLSCSAVAQAQQTITGIIQDANGTPVKGVAVCTVDTPNNKAITDENGVFTLKAEKGDYIEVNYADGKSRRLWISDNSMKISLTDMDFVTENQGTSYTERNKSQSFTTISGDELRKNSTHNLTNALNAMFPGLLVKQNTGWTDNASLTIRGGGAFSGTEPLVLVDGVPRDLQCQYGGN